MSFFRTKKFFILTLVLYLGLYVYNNLGSGIEDLSSDLLIYQMIMVQEKNQTWEYLPSAYNREDLYLAYPLLYVLNPGLEYSLFSYHLLVVLVIVATYFASGYVLWRITSNWGFAALGALLILIPHNVGFTSMGISSVGDLRGNIFAFPFYLPLGYYWLIEGIHSKRLNIIVGILAGILIYLYPLASVVTIFAFSCTGILIYKREIIKRLALFFAVYVAVALPFLFIHFTNPSAQMIPSSQLSSGEGSKLYAEIIKYRFEANAFLSSIDLARVKRTIWDSTPLILVILAGTLMLRRKKEIFSPNEWLAHKISLISIAALLVFVVGIDAINRWRISNDELPIFLEHIRSLRILGFILITETIVILSVASRILKQPLLVTVLSLVLVFSPLYFSAPAVRASARLLLPETLRGKYNLAPVIQPGEKPDMQNIVSAAEWGREKLPPLSKVFVLSQEQHDFIFKFISRRNTNLTAKEGSLWVTSGEENARHWFAERERYEEKKASKDPKEIVEFARSLGSTHLLIFKGEWQEIFSAYLEDAIYENDDYYLIEL